MGKEYSELAEIVLKGTQRAVDKLVAEAKRTGRKLVVADEDSNFPIKIQPSDNTVEKLDSK